MFKIIDPITSTTNDVKEACEFGFFYVPGKNINVSHIMELTKKYFSLSEQTKSLQSARLHPNGMGYLPSGRYKKNHNMTEVKESYQYQKNIIESPNKLQYDQYIDLMSQYAKQIFNLIILSLDLDPSHYDKSLETYAKTIDPSFDTLTLIHYPVEKNKCGTVPHMDWGYLTLLATTTNGLQIKKDGQWIEVPIIPDHFIVNIGNMMEILSGGKYKSIEHQVIVCEEKYSIAFFFEPKLDQLIIPVQITDRYKPVTYGTYMNNHLKNLQTQNLTQRNKKTFLTKKPNIFLTKN